MFKFELCSKSRLLDYKTSESFPTLTRKFFLFHHPQMRHYFSCFANPTSSSSPLACLQRRWFEQLLHQAASPPPTWIKERIRLRKRRTGEGLSPASSPWRRGMAAHFSALAWKAPHGQEPGEAPKSHRCQEAEHDWVTEHTHSSWLKSGLHHFTCAPRELPVAKVQGQPLQEHSSLLFLAHCNGRRNKADTTLFLKFSSSPLLSPGNSVSKSPPLNKKEKTPDAHTLKRKCSKERKEPLLSPEIFQL